MSAGGDVRGEETAILEALDGARLPVAAEALRAHCEDYDERGAVGPVPVPCDRRLAERLVRWLEQNRGGLRGPDWQNAFFTELTHDELGTLLEVAEQLGLGRLLDAGAQYVAERLAFMDVAEMRAFLHVEDDLPEAKKAELEALLRELEGDPAPLKAQTQAQT
ncbi:Skp1 family, dimerization domain-containing protein [Giardia muris]|uniref:Skp1 family, dimerization domain-containing protein n=1 Tax=Giardia muris TaxID=5742 RepID=A0A4Z1T5G3_GIAMU|nr:Skp1 family, dimerization domain-containing protein [Giardia muris]|eukprot:TNJ27711.1 Skp1 family, dimerization domain-containing protein [Giardia muris]